MRGFLLALLLLSSAPALAQPGGCPFNASQCRVKPTSGTVSRTEAAIAGDWLNILSLQAQTLSSTDFTSAINTALSGTVPVILPQTGTPYQVNGTLVFGSGSSLICQPGVQINSVGSSTTFTVGQPNATIRDCKFVKSGGTAILGIVSSNHFTWDGGGSDGGSGLFFNTISASYGVVANTKHINSPATAIAIQNNANHITVRNNEFQSNTGFGIWVTTGANANLIDGNWTDFNRIELLGITSTGYGNTVIANRAEGTGDNCFSISGNNNRVIGNFAYHCAFSGIYFYGNSNTGTGNTSIGNGQVHNPAAFYYDAANVGQYAGINMLGGFGGAGQNNVVSGNFIDDDQDTPTQAFGIKLGASYNAWATGTAYTINGYIYNAGNVYKANNSATSGASAPTCTSGTCSDGAVTWAFQAATPLNTRESAGNAISGNRIYRFLTAALSDTTINHNNLIQDENTLSMAGALATGSGINTVAGGFQRKVSPAWSAGLVLHYGDMVYTNTGDNIYRVVNVGGTTGATPPTQSSGTATTPDGISWLRLSAGQFWPQINVNPADVTFGTRLFLSPTNSLTGPVAVYAGAGSPLGVVTASVGSLFVSTDGGTSTTLYVKESGTDATGWVAK